MIHVTLSGDGEHSTPQLVCRVVHHVEFTAESHVPLVVRSEGEMYAPLLPHSHCIHDVEAIKGDGSRCYWRQEVLLQQFYVVFIQVDIREEVSQRLHHLMACLKELVYAFRPLTYRHLLMA